MIQNWNGQQKKLTNRKSIQLPEGGKEPIDRICTAYGFTSRQALCRHLNVSQSTMANRVSRGNFPADWVLICAMETGAPLEWLIYGQPDQRQHIEGPVYQVQSDANLNNSLGTSHLDYISIHNGLVTHQKAISVPHELLPENTTAPRIIKFDGIMWIVDNFSGELVDGYWLIEMDGIASIREIYRLPGGRLRVENGKASFECNASDMDILGKVVGRLNFME